MDFRRSTEHDGFTILEMMLSIAVFLLLATSAFALVGATTELMTEISDAQNDSSLEQQFIGSVRTAFESMSARSFLEFAVIDRGNSSPDTYLSFFETPRAFEFGVDLRDDVEIAILAAEARPDGFFRLGVYYMDAVEFARAHEEKFTDFSDIPYVELLPRMSQCSWQFYDNTARVWRPDFVQGARPSLIELVFQIEGRPHPLRSVFWCIPN
mgnify:CR=1 FL=1